MAWFGRSSCLAAMVASSAALAEPALMVVEQDFSRDPGWDHFQNRIVGTGMPRRVQDFGWALTHRAATRDSPGEIGGRIANSRIPAYYAVPLGRPLTFNDPISVSGRVALTELGPRGVSYFGFFNSRRHTWRVYASMAFRLWEENGVAQVMFDWMSGDWRGRGSETAVLIPPDGAPHTFSIDYDPDARPDAVWKDPLLEKHVTSETGNLRPIELQGEEFILERVRKDQPDVTAEELHRRLIAARDQGLIEYFHRHGRHRWWKIPNPSANHGRVTLKFDDETYVIWLDEEIRNAPVEMDRFGLFNICRYGTGQTVYFADLTVNGRKLDLSQDPHWQGFNNRATWLEPDFHSMNNFGWAQTHWAGAASGEVGGLIWRVEPEDPGFGYYADDVGILTLDDPIAFRGRVCFVDGMTDASMFFGYFNRDAYCARLDPTEAGDARISSMMGIQLNDATSVGYYFGTRLWDAQGGTQGDVRRHTFTPDRKACDFSFRYDPSSGDGGGRVVYTIDGKEGGFDVSKEQRRVGANFDRFGLACVRRGGNSVEIYFDDLTYTVRRDPSVPPVFHPQIVTERPYPVEHAGRIR